MVSEIAKQPFYLQPVNFTTMKTLGILFLVIAGACHAPSTSTTKTDGERSNNSSSDVKKVVFSTGTRGYQETVDLTKDSVIITINSSFEERPSKNIRTKITSTEWEQVNNALTGIDTGKLGELKSPTMKRAVDAASHSAIIVTTDNEYSHSFDDTDPHEQLKKLMDVILKIQAVRNK